MKIVLLERVSKLGQMGDIVEVRAGYARNFLLPTQKALRATDENIQIFEGKKAELEAKNLQTKAEAETIKQKLDGKYFVVIRSASDAGALYGSVSSKDICTATEDEGVKISKNQVILEKPIKELGLHKINISLHPEVLAHVYINVARTSDEAKLQESGQSIQDKDRVEEKKAQVEIEELFDDIGMAASLEEDPENAVPDSKIEKVPEGKA
ncbi:MAG: 50S ribosomal protein L9 [Pseudomonadota bacterium]|nr:50S ribosomal protein L9 [Pseudomonadota bacterium]